MFVGDKFFAKNFTKKIHTYLRKKNIIEGIHHLTKQLHKN